MKNVIKTMERIVNRHMTAYKEDFYNYDMPHLKEGHTYVWSLRQTGTDLTDLTIDLFKETYMDTLANKTDMELHTIAKKECTQWFVLIHERNELHYIIKDNKIKKVTKTEAITQVKQTITNQIYNAQKITA